MKKLFPLLLMSMTALFFSCEREHETDEPDDDTVFDLPVDDAVSEKIDKTIYRVGDVQTASNEKSILDNFSARFSSMSALDANADISAGDGITFDASELSEMLADAATFKTVQDAFDSGALILMNGGMASDFARLCKALGCYNPYPEDEGNQTADEVPLWVVAGNLPGAEGFYCRLSSLGKPEADDEFENSGEEDLETKSEERYEGDTAGSDPVYFSEYVQGQYCDYLIAELKESLEPANASNSPTSELTDLMSAVKIYRPASQTDKIPSSYSGKKWVERTNNYMLELDIWNAYSAAEKRQYYFIHQEFTGSFQNMCVGEYKNAAWKGYGWYGKYLETSFKNAKEPASVIYHKLSPTTSTQTTTYTSSVSFSIGGQVVTGAGGLTGGVNISNSASYNVEDVTISNKSVPTTQDAKASWLFDLRDASGSHKSFYHAFTKIRPSSLSGRETMICGADYIFSVPATCTNSWTLDYWVSVRRREFYSAFGPVKKKDYTYRHRASKTFALPAVKPE